VSAADRLLLFVAGIAGGLAGSVAGLASIATYPALLAAGLAPVAANVSNTVALVCSSIGSVSGSRPELRGTGARLRRLCAVGMLGGAAGGVLLLVTPGDSFEKAVPWLVAVGALSMLGRRRLVETAETAAETAGPIGPAGPPVRHDGPGLLAATALIGVYGGYFGAGAGVMLLGVLLLATAESLPRANAFKNVVLGLTNAVAAGTFAVFGPVRWTAVLPLGLGLLLGGRLGPVAVRRLPADGLRIAIALAGVALAVKLGVDAYG
jgi:uncharacterized membrane protein YfcA